MSKYAGYISLYFIRKDGLISIAKCDLHCRVTALVKRCKDCLKGRLEILANSIDQILEGDFNQPYITT